MKLNFWQWIGVALLVLCVGLWIYEQNKDKGTGTQTTQPTSKPAGQY